jgi:hypothetical protein
MDHSAKSNDGKETPPSEELTAILFKFSTCTYFFKIFTKLFFSVAGID